MKKKNTMNVKWLKRTLSVSAGCLICWNISMDAAEWVSLFDGQNLDGWSQHGGSAPFTVEDGCIVGTTKHNAGGNSFLCTTRDYSDFILEYEYKVDPRMNSGVQIRSHCFPMPHTYTWNGKSWNVPAGRVHGYQIEIDPSARAWSCGIYDEGRRAWLYDLKGNPTAQAAFRQNEWNKVRVEAKGDRLKTWLNDIPVADLQDDLDSCGFIALQVHGIGSESEAGREIRWRNLRIQDLESAAQTAGVEIAPSGAWTWYNDPRAIVRDGFLYAGYVRSDGAVCVTCYDLKTNERTESVLSTWREWDDHDVPGFLELADGRLAALYSTHGSRDVMYMRYAKVKDPRTQEDWGDEIAVDWSAKKFRGKVCYNNPFQLQNEPDRVYNFIRGVNWNPTLLISEDNGATWNEPINLLYHKDRPYAKYASNGRDRIDILFTDGHPRMVDNSVYHVSIQSGAVIGTDGQPLGILEQMAPLPTARGTVVYPFGSAYPKPEGTKDGRAWIWDISYDAQGSPIILHTVKAKEGDIRYFYASWDQSAKKWDSHEIAHAGAQLYKGEDDYVGGATFDPEHPQRVYISSEFNPITGAKTVHRELYQGETKDGGKKWTWTAVTRNSPADNLRPYVPRKHGMESCLLWFTGDYRAYQNFETSVRGLIVK
ncbi:MAG: DUF1080 domain-containing protein [Verrucomicrobia bacterium]|nr:DUF1080 domain-containing protein [Verrucomicrobiota bacterium]